MENCWENEKMTPFKYQVDEISDKSRNFLKLLDHSSFHKQSRKVISVYGTRTNTKNIVEPTIAVAQLEIRKINWVKLL